MKLLINKFWMLIVLSLAAGLAIGWIDTSAHWNDTGVTVGLIFISSFILGTLAHKNAWAFALIIGLSVTLFNYILHNNIQSSISIIIAFAGVYSGVTIIKLHNK